MRIFGWEVSERVQLTGVVVILAVAAFMAYRTFSGEPELSSDVNFVCVATGATFAIDREDVNVLPMPNPDTGEMTLVPCVRREDGLYVDSHYRTLIEDFGEVNQYVDATTLAVKAAP